MKNPFYFFGVSPKYKGGVEEGWSYLVVPTMVNKGGSYKTANYYIPIVTRNNNHSPTSSGIKIGFRLIWNEQ